MNDENDTWSVMLPSGAQGKIRLSPQSKDVQSSKSQLKLIHKAGLKGPLWT